MALTAALFALALAHPNIALPGVATSKAPKAGDVKCKTTTAKAFREFSQSVWRLPAWQRGAPPKKVIRAQRGKLRCMAGLGHRKAAKARWAKDRRAYNAHRVRRYAERRQHRLTRCGTPTCNVRLGWVIARKRGISRSEFDGCLVPLWSKESGWNERIWNTAGSGAGGIPQALPASKMGADANPNIGGWRVAAAQIKWGISYLASRYGGPCGGWSHSQSVGWY